MNLAVIYEVYLMLVFNKKFLQLSVSVALLFGMGHNNAIGMEEEKDTISICLKITHPLFKSSRSSEWSIENLIHGRYSGSATVANVYGGR
jgi:hypothetical protein